MPVSPEPTIDAPFLITIDTEGDNLWENPRTITTKNSHYLGRFQTLCEKHGLKPTYLTNYEMAMCPVYREFADDARRRGAAEVGMHLHAWNSPPLDEPLTADDFRYAPYLIEYPEWVMRQKIYYMTRLIQDFFGVTPLSHRAGRWGFNATYARILAEVGYQIDCSVAPKTSYRAQMGDPNGAGGPDFTRFPETPYFLDLDDIARPGKSTLLEAPFTVMDLRPSWAESLAIGPVRKVLNRLYPRAAGLRPNGSNLATLLRIVRFAAAKRRPCLEFMLHSSEFMPGGSPTFRDERAIEILYEHLDRLFTEARKHFTGATLAEFYRIQAGSASGARA